MPSIADEIQSIFGEDGRLVRMKGMEFRPQQLEMALAVESSLRNNKHLFVEAPTGVGKSLAYLIPAVLFSLSENRRAVICTHTKNLQDQLIGKDIPLVRSLLGQDFSVSSLKGRRNYLCTTRLAHALTSQRSLFDKEERESLLSIATWAETSSDGDFEHLPSGIPHNVWQSVCSEQGTCSTRHCDTTCFFQKAKARARMSTVVIMNHALFFTLLALQKREGQFLFERDFAIFDEAHTLENVAGLGIGKSLSRNQVLFAVQRVFNPKTKKGILGGRSSRTGKAAEIRSLCARAIEAAEDFFSEADRYPQRVGKPSGVCRVQSPHFISDTVTHVLEDLQSGLKALEKADDYARQKEELAAARRLVWEAQILIDEFLACDNSALTYWVERGFGKSHNTILHTAPTSVAESVGPLLFGNGPSVILTSATLAVNGSPRYVQSRLGAAGAAFLALDTPFDLRRQMQITVDADMPPPDSDEYSSSLPDAVVRDVRRSNGRALVLFTSARLLREVATTVEGRLEELGITLYKQDGLTPRSRLLELFAADVDSVLFGLDSFWMGVDVPGEALEHVIITRLPFSVPDHPLTEARMELISSSGGSTFLDYQLPEAILKLRQGIGRLIRSASDKGEITILDSRIVRKQYGPIILKSLPRCPIRVLRSGERVEDVSLEDEGR